MQRGADASASFLIKNSLTMIIMIYIYIYKDKTNPGCHPLWKLLHCCIQKGEFDFHWVHALLIHGLGAELVARPSCKRVQWINVARSLVQDV